MRCTNAALDFVDWVRETPAERSRVRAGPCRLLEVVGPTVRKKGAPARIAVPRGPRRVGPQPALLSLVDGMVIVHHNEYCLHSVLNSFHFIQVYVGNWNLITRGRWRRILSSLVIKEFFAMICPHVCQDVEIPELKITLSGRGEGTTSPVTQEIKDAVCGK